jgi:RHS repeat-associated protein
MLNASGAVVGEQRYTAFGAARAVTGELKTDYRYTGQLSKESTIGLYYFKARWYDCYLNRFLSPDSIIPDPYNPLDYDRYSYARNNPIRYSDPSGHDPWDTIGQFATGFVMEFARTNAWYSPHAQEALAVNKSESDAMLAGRVEADLATIAVGVVEFAGGVTIATGGTVAGCAATLCVASPAAIGVGAGVAAVGASTATAGAVGLGGNLALITGNNSSGGAGGSGININFDPRKLQHEFKHAGDFGITGKWNKQNASAYQQALENHVTGKNTQTITGTYRGTISVTHYFDPTTGLNVMVDTNGNYVAGWRLSSDQIKYLTTTGNVK